MAPFFKLIRWKNLLLIAIAQILVKYFLINPFGLKTNLTTSSFSVLLIATLFITAAGYIINDIIDTKADSINTPQKQIISIEISKNNAYKWYYILSVLGISFGSFLAYKIEKPLYSFIFIGITLLLYWYSKHLKSTVLIGNVLVSLLLAFSIIMIPIFEMPQQMNSLQWDFFIYLMVIIFGSYFMLIFLLNLIREIIKDIEDIDGDFNAGYKTLPIIFGRKRARNITLFITTFTLFTLVFLLLKFQINYNYFKFYVLFFIITPLLYFTYKLWNAKSKQEFTFLSSLIKMIIFFGILSIPLVSKTLQHAFN